MQRAYASGDYFRGGKPTGYGSYVEQEVPLRLTFRRFLGELKKHGAVGGRLLEIGCGYGYFLDESRECFAERWGTDLSEEAVHVAGATGAHVIHGDDRSLPIDEQFDTIAAIQVIEHVYDPREFVKRLVLRLKPGGRLVFATPDMGSLWYPLLRRLWPSFKIPEHVSFFDELSLRALLSQVGLSYILPIPYPHAFPLQLLFSKLSLPCPRFLVSRSIWIPKTTVAVVGQWRQS